jgi:Flp pilus assembly protein TadB
MKTLMIITSMLASGLVFAAMVSAEKGSIKAAISRAGFFQRNRFIKNDKKNLKSYFALYLDEATSLNFFGFPVKGIEDFILMKVFLFFVSIILINITGILLYKNFLLISIITGSILYFLPSEVLKNKIRAKSRQVNEELPDFIDILYSLINAGLALDEALSYISRECRGQISDLFKLAKVKMFEGMGRADSYYHIGRISFCDDFQRIIKIIVQADIVGNPIKDILKDLSKDFRESQRDALKMKAEKLEGNLIIVIFIFIFIPVLVLFMMPIIPQIKLLFN